MANLPGVSHATPESGLTSASPMDRGNDALSTHTLPVQAQPFSMNDHTSQHYHAVDALSSDVLPATRERLSPAEAQPKPPSTKRRKINTCFPCKQRKVKCDRQQPYCGQCQKHRIPAERCVWSTDMAPLATEMHAANALSSYSKPDASHAPIGLGASDWAGAQGTELGIDNDTRAAIERISMGQRLSAAPASQPPHDMPSASGASQTQIDPILLAGTTLALGDVNADRSHVALPQDNPLADISFWRNKVEQHQRPAHTAGDSSHMAQMEQNIAADALAMFARHNNALGGQAENALSGARASTAAATAAADTRPNHILSALLDSAALTMHSSASRLRAALDVLPNTQQTDFLLKLLQTVDLHVSYGISWRLIRIQLATLRTQLADWDRLHPPPDNLDVSFVTLLLVLLGLAAQYAEPRFFVEQGLCGTPEQVGPFVDTWVDTAQTLLATDDVLHRTNWNHIAALLLVVDLHASRGRLPMAFTTMATLTRLAELQNYHLLGSALDDESAWSSAPDSKQVSVSAVAGAFRPGVWVRPGQAVTSLPDRSHLVREAARRVWYKIASKDMTLSAVSRRASLIDPARTTTAAPLNIDEDDLPHGETHVLPAAREDGRASINTVTPYVYLIAKLGRQWGELVQTNAHTYNHVLDLDAKFRGLLSALPVFLRPDPGLEQLPEVRQEQAQRPYLAMHRLIVFEAVNHRLLLLHRDFFGRGHYDEKYAYSTRVAVDAARTIISCRQQIDNVHPAVQRYAAFRHHLFQAGVVLVLHLLDLAHNAQGSSQVAHQLRDDVALIISYLAPAGDQTVRSQLPMSQKVAIRLLEFLVAASARTPKTDVEDRLAGAPVSLVSLEDGSSALFPLGVAPGTDSVVDAAAGLAAHMIDPAFATNSSLYDFFAELDELMVPIY